MSELPLREGHQKREARFVTRAGWAIPAHYGNPLAEHQAVRHGVGLVDQSFRGKLRLTGKDRAEFLHGMVTNDVQRLAPGMGCYATITNVKAKMLSDCRIYRLADSLLLDLEPEVVQKIQGHLDRYIIASDVTIDNLTETWGLLSLYGPKAPDLLARGFNLADLPQMEFACLETSMASINVLVARHEITGEIGYDLFLPVSELASLFQTLIEAGARPVGQVAFNTLRIEAGIPQYGIDMDESYFPMEAGLAERAISYTKGCYLGQETIARAMTQGHMNRFLIGLEVKGDVFPQKGQPILKDDRTIGSITSGIRSPCLGQIIALGYIHRDFAKPGTEVSVAVGTKPQAATVVALPFYKRTS